MKKGFTLIEVLLALAIFTIIGVATFRHVQQIMNTKKAALSELDSYDGIRAALSMMSNDLSQAFHVLTEDLGEEAQAALAQGTQTARTLFDGRKDTLIFTALSHRVFYRDRKECDQAEISYYLQPNGKSGTSSLVKRESGMIDNDLFAGGSTYTLLDNVVSLQFQYWDDKITKWVDDWNSDGRNTRDRFPFAIKVKIAVDTGHPKPLTVETQMKIAFPNNESSLAQF